MTKKNLVLGGILIILIVLAYFYQGPLKEWRSNLGKPKNFLAKIDVNQIDKIEIIKSDQVTILEKQNDQWKIAGTKDFYLKPEVADSLISGLTEAIEAKLELISTNNEKKKEFKTDKSGTHVKLSQGEEVMADFIVGKLTNDFSSTYITRPEINETYAIKVNIYSIFNRDDWYDKTIFASDKEKINKIRFQYPNREFTVEKSITKGAENSESTEVWQGTIPYKFKVNKEKIDKILEIMSNLTAAEIPEQTFAGTGLEKHLIIVQATGEGVDNTIMIGDDNGEGLYYTKRGDSDNIYLIAKEQRDELDKRIWQLR